MKFFPINMKSNNKLVSFSFFFLQWEELENSIVLSKAKRGEEVGIICFSKIALIFIHLFIWFLLQVTVKNIEAAWSHPK